MVIRKRTATKKIGVAISRKAKGKGPQKSPEKWIRTTVMIREINHGKIKSITYWEKKGIKEVVDEALKLYLKGKKSKPLPKKK
ncbi:MAG: hypothetical protein A2Y79_14350 [Deltaproteobacteria bacterium RBG_13_43_22]|nr:MAG: hypothetical protein A2Y79_14350 [Deltaproteobacteria bacterium RBG_13_43_22]